MNLSDVERLGECSMFINGETSSILNKYESPLDNVTMNFITTDGESYRPKGSVNTAFNDVLIEPCKSKIKHITSSSNTNSVKQSRYSKVTSFQRTYSTKIEMIGGENLKNAGLPKASDSYGDGVSIVVNDEVKQLIFDKTFCADNSGAEMLRLIEKSNFDTLHNVYPLFTDHNLLYAAYQEMKSKPGNMTPDNLTLDGVDENYFIKFRDEMSNETYKPKPTKRVLIPKSNGKTRPLGIPAIKDKLIQYVLKQLLEATYEKKFSDYSHGYRPNKGAHTAAKNLRQ